MIKYVFIAIYIALIIFVGLKSRKSTSEGTDGYLLGGRSIGPVATAFSFASTYISGVCIVLSGKYGWLYGVGALYNPLMNVLFSIVFMWFFLGKKSRTMSEKLNVQTLPDFLRVRYGGADIFKFLGGIIIFIFMVPYTATVFTSLSYMFESVFSIPYGASLVAMAALAAFYLAIGGYKAAATLDIIQGGIMVIGGIAIAFYTLKAPEVGGFANGIKKLAEINPDIATMTFRGNKEIFVGIIPMLILTSIAPNGMPQLVSKFFAVSDARVMNKGGVICTIVGSLVLFSVHIPGVFVRLFYDTVPVDPVTGQENIDLMIPQILSNILPEFFLAIVLLLILAASMSTLAGLTLVSSSAVGMDLVKGYIKKDMPMERVTVLMRILSILFVLAALIIALLRPAGVMSLMSLSWGALAGFFMAPYVCGILYKGTTKCGAIAGGVLGFMIAVGLPIFTEVSTTDACAAAIIISVIVTLAVSILTPKLSSEFIAQIYEQKSISV